MSATAPSPVTPERAATSAPAGTSVRAADVAVIGGGVIGLSCAWRLRAEGLSVVVLDPAPARGASWAAAGMLAPVTETSYGEEALMRLGIVAASRWPAWAEELSAASGHDPGLREADTLVLAHDVGDKAELDRFADYAAGLGLPVEPLSPRECRTLEPMVAPDIRGGVLAPDRSIHNRDLLAALLAACEASGVRFVRQAAGLLIRGDRCVGVELPGGDTFEATTTVLAAGATSALIPGLPGELIPPVRPVRGMVLRLRTPPDYLRAGGVLSRTLRGSVAGTHVYLVPRADGEIVVGATSDEVGYDDRVTAGGVWELLRDARALLPVISELTFAEASSGLRPATPDNAPLVGASGVDGLIVATGHGRNGILLAPVTADAVVALVTAGRTTAELEPFGPQRFQAQPVSA